jgi:methylthioribose-1-phosphate isomerase
VKTLEWSGRVLRLIDQTRLPGELVYRDCLRPEDVADAIRTLQVRGAPVIGIAAAYGVALAALAAPANNLDAWRRAVDQAAELLLATRPTAINLRHAVDLALAAADAATSASEGASRILEVAAEMGRTDDTANRRIGENGAPLLANAHNVLTHCNAGGLATMGYGTALGIIRALHARGRSLHVWVDETRPVLQGARLTAWELLHEGIGHTVIPDSTAATLMRQGRVDAVVVGADRIAANGDVANKIGTYGLAVLARAHRVPFYVAAPLSTVDLATPNGAAIPIEERHPDEVRRIGGVQLVPLDSPVLNLAFDVTPHELITAIVTEAGVASAPYGARLAGLLARVPAISG